MAIGLVLGLIAVLPANVHTHPARASSSGDLLAVGQTGTTGQVTSTLRTTTPTPAPTPRQTLHYRPVGCIASGPWTARTHGAPRKVVALTFDDGPSTYTRSFVQMLRARHVPATFFMIGDQITGAYRSVLDEELRDGDALGDHTWTHPDLDALSTAAVRNQLELTRDTIATLSGYTPCVFRPPYGDYSSSVIQTARSLGLSTILWEVDPSDYLQPGVGAIEQRVLSGVVPGSIVLSHDGGGPRAQTLAAYPSIIASLRHRGYRFETVPQLLGFRGIYRRCRLQCGEAAVEGPLPQGSIVESG